VDEGFLLGYASNAHGYRSFNNTTSLVEIVVDVHLMNLMARKGMLLMSLQEMMYHPVKQSRNYPLVK
jgi:hypothetical protein